MLTLKKVNDKIATLANNWELRGGEGYGYFYWHNSNAVCMLTQTKPVMVYRLNELTLEQWVDEFWDRYNTYD